MKGYPAASVAALLVTAFCGAGLLAAGVTRGLTAEYFLGEEHTGRPAVATIDKDISTDALTRAWHGRPPEKFNARWFGYLNVPADGRYTFSTTSDDGSYLAVDGERVLDNGGPHGPLTKRASVDLMRGPHAILIEYTQYTAGYEMSWAWARDGQAESAVPGWLLSTQRASYTRVLLARLSEIGWWICGSVALFLIAASLVDRSVRAPLAAAAVVPVFVALAVLHLWPLASDPAHLSRNDNGDTLFNEWVMAWVVHQAPRDLRHLFDANILYPQRSTLAYSDALIWHSILAAPVLWLGGSPVLAYNLVLIAGFALTGWAMCILIARWTGSWLAGLVAGSIFAFNGHLLTRLPHIQAQHAEFLPLALLALDHLLRQPRPRAAMLLGAAVALQALASIYLLVFTTVALIAGTLSRPRDWLGPRLVPVLRAILIGAAFSAVVLVPLVWPYWRVTREQGFTRGVEGMSFYAARVTDYLATPARIHVATWSARFFKGNAFFPGALATALTTIALVTGTAWTDRRARMCLVAGAAGFYLSFGTKLPGYSLLYRLLPLLQAVRQVSRFGYLVIFAAAALAGFGVIVLKGWLPRRAWPPLAAAILFAAALEPLAAPLGFTYFDGIPGIYRRLPERPGIVVAELPFPAGAAVFHHAPYMLNSTAHWRPMVNGYSGFLPPSFYEHVRGFASFPQPAAVDALRRAGVTHVFVHADEYAPGTLAVLDGMPGVRKIESEGKIRLYELQ